MHHPDMKDKVCELIAKCGSLRQVCRQPGMPDRATVSRWVIEDPLFAAKYARAKRIGIDDFVEQTLEIADTPVEAIETTEGPLGTTIKTSDALGHRKLQVETRRWRAERMEPKAYGARSGIELSGDLEVKSMDRTARAARVAALLAIAEQRKASLADDDFIDDIA